MDALSIIARELAKPFTHTVTTRYADGACQRHYVLVDYAAIWRSGEPMAGDDAAEARFWSLEEALAKVAWVETARVIQLAWERFGSGR